MLFDILIAGLRVRIEHRYDEVKTRCADYIVLTEGTPDAVISATDEQLRWAWDLEKIPAPEAEFYCVHRHLYAQLPQYDAFWIHGCAVEMNGSVYIFTARSGYGKTTHARLWLKAFGEKARVINGDNPLIRLIDERFIAYGSPFGGKEGYNVNTSAPLKGICYLTHEDENSIRKMDPQMAYAQILRDSYRYMNEENSELWMKLLEQFVQKVPVYQLCCNQDVEAAYVAYEGMKNG